MLKLNLRGIAKDLDLAIVFFDEALKTLEGLDDKNITDKERQVLKVISQKCMNLENLREETDIMVIERALHCYNVEKAVKEISRVKEEFTDARSLINV